MTKNHPTQRGWRRKTFTLAEVMVSLGVMALLASGIYGSCILGMKMMSASRFSVEAESAAMDQVSILFNQPFAVLWDYPNTTTKVNTLPGYVDTPTSKRSVFVNTGEIRSVVLCTTSTPQYVDVLVTVWGSGYGVTHSGTSLELIASASATRYNTQR